jgi:hypothetical protein
MIGFQLTVSRHRILQFAGSQVYHYTDFGGLGVLMLEQTPQVTACWRNYRNESSHLAPLLF